MRLKSEDILKPGAVLMVDKVDVNDPEIKKMLRDLKKRQKKLIRMRDAPFENVTITI